MKIEQIKTPKGVEYDDSPQLSPRWRELHVGRVGASRLLDWLAVGKRDGKPLKARKDLEREIGFEKAFGIGFSKYVTPAMQAGIDNEAYVRDQYSSKLGVAVRQAGAFYDKWSIASPDGLVDADGGIEIKWLQDSNWTEVVLSGKPLPEHYMQIQGNLRLSGRTWWDYIAANGNTGRFVIITVHRDEELIQRIDECVRAVDDIEPISTDNLYELNGDTPKVPVSEVVWA
jgi:hypothetical protein